MEPKNDHYRALIGVEMQKRKDLESTSGIFRASATSIPLLLIFQWYIWLLLLYSANYYSPPISTEQNPNFCSWRTSQNWDSALLPWFRQLRMARYSIKTLARLSPTSIVVYSAKRLSLAHPSGHWSSLVVRVHFPMSLVSFSILLPPPLLNLMGSRGRPYFHHRCSIYCFLLLFTRFVVLNVSLGFSKSFSSCGIAFVVVLCLSFAVIEVVASISLLVVIDAVTYVASNCKALLAATSFDFGNVSVLDPR